MNKKSRPVYLNLFQIKMPIMAIMSILHRASGALLVLAIPYIAYLLSQSLASEQGFLQVQQHLSGFIVRFLLLILGWSILHHLLSGIRFLFIDFDIGVDKINGRLTAWMVTIIAAAVAMLVGAIMLGVTQ